MHAEMRFHLEMEAERLERRGLSPEEARRQAHIRFGGIENVKEQARDTRALPWIDAAALDARLGIRMMLKYRGVTLAGGFAMAVAIAIGSMSYEVLSEAMNPALPLPDGDRIVAIQFATDTPGSPKRDVVPEFLGLRTELRSIEDVSAFHSVRLNLVTPDSTPEPVTVAAISASAFDLTRTAPLLGRILVADDERPGARPVLVIGYGAWQSRFAGDTNIIGRTVSLGETSSTIVGVMPDGFRFPVDHQFWVPLRERPTLYQPLGGHDIYMFGRLSTGVTMTQAQAELTTISRRLAQDRPEIFARVRLVVHPYTREFSGLVTPGRLWMVRVAQLLISALALVVAVNLAILVYARTIGRLGEIAVRTALGASRRRILSQLFVEALALSLVGALAGLALTGVALRQVHYFVTIGGGSPFWIHYGLSFGTIAYALTIAIGAAFVIGVVPGLKATGRSVNAHLHHLHGRTGARLGPMWTSLIVAQVAIAVAVLPAAVYLAWLAARMEFIGPGFDTAHVIVSVVALGDDSSRVDADRWRVRQTDILSRLAQVPGVSGVTFSSAVPGFGSGGRQIDFADGRESTDAAPIETSSIYGGTGLLSVYDATIVAGRAFDAHDLDAASAVIVNETFATRHLGGRAVLGTRFRYAHLPEWYQIVGVVRDFPTFPPSLTLDGEPVVYHPVSTGTTKAVVFSTKFAGPIPNGAATRLREIAAEIDPALQVRRVVPLARYYSDARLLWRNLAWGVGLVTVSVLLLSAAGIYALMSLTVRQRTREIGIRTALGAEPRRLILSVLQRSAGQIAIGLGAGSVLSAAVCSAAGLGLARGATLVGSVAIIMLVVGVLAAAGPARQILRTQATDALKAE
jgi:predicted permease